MIPSAEKQRFIGQDPRGNLSLLEQDRAQMLPLYEKNFRALLPERKDAAILDFGCGYGTFTRYLTAIGYSHVVGVDPDERCADFSRQHSTAPIIHTADTMAYLRQHPAHFDCIVAINVLSYFEREKSLEWFTALASALKPGGILLLEVANAAAFTGQVDYIQDPFMKSLYTEISLKTYLESAALCEIQIRPLRIPCSNWRRALWLMGRSCWYGILRFIYLLERGASERNPTIFHSRIVAIASRPRAQ